MPTPSARRPADLLLLHPFEPRILLVLAEGPAHGYPIIRIIEERDSSWRRVLAANLYRRLRDMRDRRLVEEVVHAPDDDVPDDERQRRTFAVTELGRRVAVAEARRLGTLVADAKRVPRGV